MEGGGYLSWKSGEVDDVEVEGDRVKVGRVQLRQTFLPNLALNNYGY